MVTKIIPLFAFFSIHLRYIRMEDKMPLVSLFEGIEIYMYNNGREHNPPHFHAVYGEFECLVDIGKVK